MNIIKTNFEYITSKLALRDMNKIDRTILHHADAENCSADDIHRWHLNNGWARNWIQLLS